MALRYCPPFAAFDPEQHALAVDVADLEGRDLGNAQAGAISDRQRRLVLEAGRRVQQTGNLVRAQHSRHLTRVHHSDQPAREVGPVERVREEEPQRRDDAVHRRHGNAGLALLDLEAAQILRHGRVRRAPQKRGEAPDVADVVALGLEREPAHIHVVDQSLAQRADRGDGNEIAHCTAPQAKGAAMLNPRPMPLNGRATVLILPRLQ